jgi:hypothetical protein
LNLFRKKFTRGRVVPIISASVSCELPQGALFRKDAEGRIRRGLLEQDLIGAVARAYKEGLEKGTSIPEQPAAGPRPVAAFQATPSPTDRKLGIVVGLALVAMRVWRRVRGRHDQRA